PPSVATSSLACEPVPGPQARLLAATEDEPVPGPQARLLAVTEDELPDARSPLASIMHSLKSYTASKINAILKRSGQFWQHESYDHWVRDDDELARIVEYIAWNPVKAKLVK